MKSKIAESKSLLMMLKNSTGEFVAVILSFLSPVGFIMLAVGAFIMLDTLIGWYKHKAKPEGANSKGLRVGFTSKSIIYCLTVLTFYLIDYAMINEMLVTVIPFQFIVTKGVALVLIWIELLSINENFKELKGISLAEALKGLIKGIGIAKKGVNEIRKK